MNPQRNLGQEDIQQSAGDLMSFFLGASNQHDKAHLEERTGLCMDTTADGTTQIPHDINSRNCRHEVYSRSNLRLRQSPGGRGPSAMRANRII